MLLKNNTVKTCTCRLNCSTNDALLKINITRTIPASPLKQMRKYQDGGSEHQKELAGITHETNVGNRCNFVHLECTYLIFQHATLSSLIK